MSDKRPDRPLVSGRSPSARRAMERHGEPAPRAAAEAGVLLRLLEVELGLAVLCERVVPELSDAAAILQLRQTAHECRGRAQTLIYELERRDGSPPRDSEIEPPLSLDARDLEDAGAALPDALATLRGEVQGAYERAIRNVEAPLAAALRELIPADAG